MKLALQLSKRDTGNTTIVIEHNLDVIKTADWLIDMGRKARPGVGLSLVRGRRMS